MFVCIECHSKDRNVTRCKKLYDEHITHTTIVASCNICGNVKELVWCINYEYIPGNTLKKGKAAGSGN